MRNMRLSRYNALLEESDSKFARVLKQARERGSSNWLTALPLAKYGFTLNKGQFRDSLLLRYGKELSGLPETCACGTPMTINHALNCSRGGYIIIRHNSVRDFLANQISQVCKVVTVEPPLQQLEGETFTRRGTLTGEHARPDIKARGFYRDGQHAFFDIKLLNPNSESYLDVPTKKVYERAERAKRGLYNERIINVEHGTFCPLVFSVSGRAGQEAKTFLRMLGDKLAHKHSQEYSSVMNFIKCKLAFLVRKLVLLCIRGSRTPKTIENDYVNDFEFACFASKL